MSPYRSWQQVAGYFDGDGTIAISDMSNQPYKLGLSLVFVDQSREQISMLSDFLVKRGLRPSNILRTSRGTASMIAISRFDSVLLALRGMVPYLYKKAIEAQGALDYYGGRLTGNDLCTLFRKEVDAGRRERRNRRVVLDVPYTYTEGDKLMKIRRRERVRRAIERTRAKVSEQDYENIRKEHFGEGRPLRDLIKKYPRYSKETIRRILRRDRGYVLVSGKGRRFSSNGQNEGLGILLSDSP